MCGAARRQLIGPVDREKSVGKAEIEEMVDMEEDDVRVVATVSPPALLEVAIVLSSPPW